MSPPDEGHREEHRGKHRGDNHDRRSDGLIGARVAPEGEDPPLTEQQMQLMAYVDDELSRDERQAFETAMTHNPGLAAEVVKHQNLLSMTRSMALMEPSDHETRRFWGRFYNRTEWRLGWCLLIVGIVALVGEALYLLMGTDELGVTTKISILLVLCGGVILLWNTVRLRMRTSQFDRYRGVMR